MPNQSNGDSKLTPDFTTVSSNLSTVRLYTEMDPYIYSVDNRPLQDLDDNSRVLAQAVDAAITTSLTKEVLGAAFDAGVVGFDTHLLGLNATNPSVGVLSLSPGILMIKAQVSTSDTREILKRAGSPMTTLVSVAAPAEVGQEVKYLIQVRYRDFDTTTDFPTYLKANQFSSEGILNGWLEISALSGVPAAIGASVAPAVDVGWLPVYEITARSGDTTVTVAPAASAVDRTSKLLQTSDVSLAAFGNSLSQNGYQRLPNGMIMQWGKATIPPGAGTEVVLPISYPTATLTAQATVQNLVAENHMASVGAIAPNSIVLRHDATTNQDVFWTTYGH